MKSNSSQCIIRPHLGIGPIKFGMTRYTVRKILEKPYQEFMKTPDSKVATDDFREFHFHVYYDDDLLCRAVELFPGSKATLDGHRLAGQTYQQVSSLLCKIDPEPIVNLSVVTFEKLGIVLYVPDMDDEDPEAKVESVFVMK